MSVMTKPIRANDLESSDDHLQSVIACHFDPKDGSRFWLDRQKSLGIDARREIRCVADLALLGDTTADDLSDRPLTDYIPRQFHRHTDCFVLGQTGGTTGQGTWTAYRLDEFHEAFVQPFVVAAERIGFPRGEQWLYIGPSGPHIIGKAARHLAESMGSADPFCVDFDARWAKHLPEGSFAARRYLQHVVEQGLDIIRHQQIGVLFTTPVVLSALAEAMAPSQRERIHAVHYGGMAILPEELEKFQTRLFPNAVHVSGYGNTLFGCCMELNTSAGRPLDYYPFGNRLHFEVIDEDGNSLHVGQTGQVRCSRLDEGILIVRLRERDEATLIDPPPDAPGGFELPGLRNPHTAPTPGVRLAVGLY